MENKEKMSYAAAIIVLATSLYSYFASPLFMPAFGLGAVGYALSAVFSLYSLCALRLNEKRKSKVIAESILALDVLMLFFLVSPQSYSSGDFLLSATSFIVLISVFATAVSSLGILGFTNRKILFLFITLTVVVIFTQSFYVEPSTSIARFSGTVLDDNWWEALNWIRNNTQECSVVATYWDPGHFIRAIAQRGAVFDGATQGAQTTFPAPGHEDGLVIVPYENGIEHIIFYKDGNATTSRINDIAISLMTENESLALELLKNYRKPGCDMYYLATADLIGKSVWWTYFSTWNPTESKGTAYSYQILSLSSVRPLLNQNALVYSYPFSQDQAFLVIGINDTFRSFLQQGNTQPVSVETLIYYSESGDVLLNIDTEAPVKGTLFLQPDKQLTVFIPPELQNSIFTKLFLFNGAGLSNFEFVNQWGGEVKLFKVSFGD